jgi:hypothetical protein
MSMFLLLRSDSPEAQEWDRRVACEAEHQARIEAAFDRADAFDRLGDVELALDWLDQAGELSGGLTPAYRAKRLRLGRERARPRESPAKDPAQESGVLVELRARSQLGGEESGDRRRRRGADQRP